MGLKGNVAREYAAAGLPSISAADAQAMDQGALNDIVSKVQQAFDATNPATKFADLHPDAQTAIVSLAYQYGPNLAVRTPSFWKDVTSGDLGAAVGELRNFHDAYPTRRNLEADRMQRGIAPSAPLAPRVPLQLSPFPLT